MSQRLKRQQSRTEDASVPSKRRKGRSSPRIEDDDALTSSTIANVGSHIQSTAGISGGGGMDASGDEMEDGGTSGTNIWTPRPISDLKISSIYNRSAPEAPAEVRRTHSPLTDLFRKDLISAMKLPDSEPLAADEYWLISDPWKQEWERGVQVPVNPDSLPEPSVTVISQGERSRHSEFKLPKGKYVRITSGEGFSSDIHYLSNVPTESERACAYDLDDCDLAWLNNLNGERALMGLSPIREDQLERVLEEMEVRCWKKIQGIVRSEEGLGIEFDDDVICDVCRSPDSEDGNEMVFCDNCNICVHQACYGITTIPAGSWLCRTCALSQRPECVLCPNRGGAMKCTRSGQKWAHVSCALWIPEVSIGCVERMEPITKISSIPQSRWALICVLCRERVGACIQCSVKTCKTAYHVTCAFKHGLEMKAIIEDESAEDGVKLRSYCQKHSLKKAKMIAGKGSGSEEEEARRRKRKDMTSEERSQAKAAKLQEIEAEFDKHMTLKDVPPQHLDLDQEAITFIYNYWKLKRKAGGNKPLIAPRTDDIDMLGRAQVQADQEKMRMFVQLRQDLERVRNLCYMVSRREKLSRTFFKIREQTFHKQVNVLTTLGTSLADDDAAAIIQANHGPSIYDRLYSHEIQEPYPEIDDLISRISGVHTETIKKSATSPINGLIKRPPTSPNDANNPYKRTYFNGATSRRRGSSLCSMTSDSETEFQHRQNNKLLGTNSSSSKLLGIRTDSSADEGSITTPIPKKQKQNNTSNDNNKSSSLQKMERELLTDHSSMSGDTSSDELMILPKSGPSSRIKEIYSDSDDDDRKGESSRSMFMRTKAAVKEFTPAQAQAKKDKLTSPNGKSPRGRKPKRKVSGDSRKPEPTELIVPQRQAAKKASESIRHSTVRTKEPGDVDMKPVIEDKEPQQQITPPSRKKNKKDNGRTSSDIYDFEKELTGDSAVDIIAYVPQRQAAKKAAEHIKGLGKPGEVPVPGGEVADTKKSSSKPSDASNKKPVKISSLSSSESDNEDDAQEKARRIQRTVFGKSRDKDIRKDVSSNVSDRPFLDKEASDDSDEESLTKPTSTKQKRENDAIFRRRASHESSSARRDAIINKSSTITTTAATESISGNRKQKQSPSKKLKTSDRRPDSKFQLPPNTSSSSTTTKSSSTPVTTTKPTSDSTGRNKKSTSVTTPVVPTPRSPTSTKDRVTATPGRSGPTRRSVSSSSSSSSGSSGSSSSASSSSGSSSSSSGSSSSGSSSDDSSSSSDSETEKRTKGTEKSPLKTTGGAPTPSATVSATAIPAETNKQGRRSTPRRQEIPAAAAAATTKIGETKSTSKSSLATSSGSRKSITDEKTNKIEASERKQSIEPEIKKTSQKKSVESRRKSISKDTTPSPTKKSITNRESSTESIRNKNRQSSPPKEMLSPPRRRPSTTAKVDATSKKSETTSKRDTTPKRVETPKRGEATPKRDVTPKRREATPKRDATPKRGENTPKRGETPRRDTTPKRIETPRRETTPRRRDSTKAKEDIIEINKPDSEEIKVDESKRSKPMPKCKKKDLGILSDEVMEIESGKVSPVVKKPEEIPIVAPEEPILLPSPPRVVSPPPVAQQRSIFSPPHQKDQELYDFEREILAVDETMGRAASESSDLGTGNQSSHSTDDARSSMPPPLSFSFGNEFLFKEDTKEDTARETYNLVQKLRVSYAKTIPADGEDIDEGPPPTPGPVEKPKEEEMEPPPVSKPLTPPPVSKPPSPPPPVAYNAMEVKVGPPERDKLDQTHGAQADERWVPPSPIPTVQAAVPSPLPQASSIPEIPPASVPELPPATPSEYMARKWAESEMLPSRRSSSSSGSSTASSSSHREELTHPPPPPVLPPTPLGELTGYSGIGSLVADPMYYGSHPHLYPGMDPNSYPLYPPYSLPPPAPYSTLLPPQLEENTCSGAAFTSSQHNMALTAALMSPGAPQNAPFMHIPHQPQPSPVPSEPPPPTPPNFLHTQPPLPSPILEPSTPSTPLPASVSEPPTPPPVVNHKATTPKHVDFVTPPPPAATNAHPGKKSPSKPTRSSTRVIPKPPTPKPVAPQSPRPREKKTARGGYGNRGRGRGKGKTAGRGSFITKGAQVPSKLQGTVYDFDDDDFDAPPTPGVENLRAMRERRRSTDVHKLEESYNDSRSDEGSFTAASPPPMGRNFPDVVQPVLPGPVDMRTYSGGTYTSPSPMVRNNDDLPPTSNAIPEGTLENQSQLLRSFDNEEPHPVAEFVEDLEKELHSALEASRPERIPSPKPIPQIQQQLQTTVTLQESSRNQLKVKIKGPFLDANYTSATPVVPTTVSGDPSIATGSGAGMSSMQGASMASSGPSNLRRMRKKELLRQYWTQDMNMEDNTNALGSPTPVAAAATAAPVSRGIITIPKAVASMTSIPTREDYKAVVDANMEKKRRKGGVFSDDMDATQSSLALAAAQKKRGRPKVGLPQVVPVVSVSATTTAVAPKLKIRLGTSPSTESEDRRLLRVRPPKKRLSASIQIPTIEELKRESMKFRKKIMADFDSKHSGSSSSSSKKEKKKDKKQRTSSVVNEDICVVLDSSASNNDNNGANTLINKSTTDITKNSSSPILITNNSTEKSAPKLIIRLGKRPSDLKTTTTTSNSSNNNKSSSHNNTNIIINNPSSPSIIKSASDCVPTPPPSSEERLSGSEQTPNNNNNNNSSSTSSTPTPPQNLNKKQSASTSSSKLEGNNSETLKIRTSKVTPIRLKISRSEEGYVMASKQKQQQQNIDSKLIDDNSSINKISTPNIPPPIPPPPPNTSSTSNTSDNTTIVVNSETSSSKNTEQTSTNVPVKQIQEVR